MPWAPPRLCPLHGLPRPSGRSCPACTRVYDQRRPAHFQFYTSVAWRELRARVLLEQPRCAVAGCGRPSVDVDHIIPRTLRPEFALVRSNLRGLCRHCHGRVTRGGQGGEG